MKKKIGSDAKLFLARTAKSGHRLNMWREFANSKVLVRDGSPAMRLRQRRDPMTDVQANEDGRDRERRFGTEYGSHRFQSEAHALSAAGEINPYSCPTCGSQNTQRLSTAYMSGVSQFSAVTSGVGWAGAPVFGSGWTSGTSQTQLSKIAAPPTEKLSERSLPAFPRAIHRSGALHYLSAFRSHSGLRTSGRCFRHFAGNRRLSFGWLRRSPSTRRSGPNCVGSGSSILCVFGAGRFLFLAEAPD